MKKKVISIFVMLMLIMSLIPNSFVHATDSSYKVTVTPDKAEVKAGEKITYTVILDVNVDITTGLFELSIPEGLTYVEGSAKLDSKVAGLNIVEKDFVEAEKMITIANNTPFSLSGTIATFECTVNSDATGEQEVKFINAEVSELINNSFIEVAGTTVSAKTTVVVPVTGISLEKAETTINASESEKLVATVKPGTATNKKINWKSSDASIAAVDENGNVTAKREGTATITATTVDGNFTATCAVTVVCGHKNTTKHDAVASTCISQGTAEYTICDDCGKIISGSNEKLPLGNHNFGDLIAEVPATHTETELKAGAKAHYICSVCNKIFNEAKQEVSEADLVIPAPTHTYGDWTANDSKEVNENIEVDVETYHWKNCGCGNIVKEEHKGGEATCSKKAVCEVCKKEYGTLDSSKHVNTEIKDAKEATCTEKGYSGDTYCNDCKKTVEKGKEIEAIGHKGGKATCSKKAVCEVCKEEYGELDYSNHVNTEIKDAKEATCTEKGYSGDTYCNDCKKTVEKGKEIEAIGHKGGKATCSKKAVCEVCKEEYGELDYSNHVNTEIKDKKEATTTEKGYSGDTYCNDCKKIVKKGEVIPVLASQGTGTSTPVSAPAQPQASSPASNLGVGVLTGDNSNIVLWVSLLVISGIGFVVIAKCKKNTKRANKH